MHTINKHRQTFLDEFYLDANQEVRRSKDGYLGRFKKDDLANFFVSTTRGISYKYCQVPRQRTTVRKSHLVLLLSGVNVPDNCEVDHIDGNSLNDMPSNLRVVTTEINSKNRKIRYDNTSGHTGIRWSNYHQHYVIRRTVKGKRLSRSRKSLAEAIEVLEGLTAMDNDYTTRHGI